MRPVIALLALLAVPLSAPPAQAALCPSGQRALSFDLATGTGPVGAPDPRWYVDYPLPGPAFHVAPAPGWVSPAGWISATGGTPAGAGVHAYQMVFAAAPVGFATISLSYAADDDVTWHVNGQIVGSGTAAAGSWHTLTVTTPFIRGAHNILEAKVTNHSGPEGLAVRGTAWSCF